MDNYLGDLADIVRASAGAIDDQTTTTTTTATTSSDNHMMSGWDFGSSPDARLYQDLYSFPEPLSLQDIDPISSPGGPFLDTGVESGGSLSGGGVFTSNTGGLMLQQHGVAASAQNNNYHLCHGYNISSNKMAHHQIFNTSSVNNTDHGKSNNNNNNNNNNNVRVKLLPMQAAASPNNVGVKRSFGFVSSDMMSVNNASCGGGTTTTGIEIPSPRNSGIKRRKTQAKKVVCIPATGAANSRQTGEVVPSDLWAWRKYGQKPIKGSPFPRGYYRCSSSKGCSARKQVERSRTDPNMLVITYTSEHNHPWPTQRNALAGSSRSSNHPSKPASDPLLSPSSHTDEVLVKDEMTDKEVLDDDIDTQNVPMSSANYNGLTGTVSATMTPASMQEEEALNDKQIENKFEKNNIEDYEGDDQILINDNYRPTIMPQTNCQQQCDQDFFKDLVEFEGDDPLNLLFTQEAKGSDPFNGFFDWTTRDFATTKGGEDCDQNNGSTSG